MASQLVHI